MRLYEGMFLLDDARCSENFQAATREVHSILDKSHAEVFTAEKWDERRLCYPVEGRTRAVYYLVRFAAAFDALRAIERDCQLNDTILRVLILHDEQNEKLHKAGLLALRPDEPGQPIQLLGKRSPVDRPATEAEGRAGGPDGRRPATLSEGPATDTGDRGEPGGAADAR